MSDRPRDLFDDKEFDEETNRLQHETAGMPRIIVAVFLAVALIMLGVAAVAAAGAARTLSRERSAPGWVVELLTRRDTNGQVFYYPVVEFYALDESRQTVQLPEGSTPPAYIEGQEVVVRYDPDRPSSARIESSASALGMWIVPIITGVIGLAFGTATAFAIWMLKDELTGKA
jgi:hypothetical protein